MCVRYRCTDRHGHHISQRVCVNGCGGDFDGGLGRAVEVVQFGSGEESVCGGGVRGGECFAGEEQPPHRRQPVRAGRRPEERREHGGHEMQHRDLTAVDDVGQIIGVLVATVFRDDQGSAHSERKEELPDGHIEDGRRFLQDPITGADPVVFGHPRETIHNRLMGDHDPLRAARGARGENDIRRIRRGEGARQHRRRTLPTYQSCRYRGVVEEVTVDDHPRGRVVEDVRHPLARVLRIDRHIRCPGPYDREQCSHQIDTAGQLDCDAVPHPHTTFDQHVCQSVDPRIELGVGPLGSTVVDDRDRIRRCSHTVLDDCIQRRTRDLGHPSRRPCRRDFARERHVQRSDRAVRGGCEHLDDALENCRELRGNVGVEQIGPIRQPHPRLGPCLRGEREWVVRRFPARLTENRDSGVVPDEFERLGVRRVVLVDHQRVEQRLVPAQTLQLGERYLMILDQRGVLGLYPAHRVGKAEPALQLHDHRNRVDERAHRVLDPVDLRGTARHNGTEYNRVLAGDRIQEHRPDRLQQTAHRGTGRSGHIGKSCAGVGVEFHHDVFGQSRDARTSLGRNEGRLQDRGEHVGPPLQRSLGIACRHPGQELRERQIRFDHVGRPSVRLPHRFEKSDHGPTVDERVVNRQDERVAGPIPHDRRAHQRRPREVDPGRAVTFGDLFDVGHVGDVDDRDRDVHRGRHDCNGLAPGRGSNRDLQVREPLEQLVQRNPESLRLAGTVEVEHGLGSVDVDSPVTRPEHRLHHEPVLQRCQGVHIGQLAIDALPALEIGLRHATREHVRRRSSNQDR